MMSRSSSMLSGRVLLALWMVVACCAAVVLGQKSYSINSINSNIYVSPSTCDVSVVETYVYDFLGSYSTVARAIPYTIASSSGFQSSSLNVQVLTAGYTVSKSTSDQQDAKFIVVNMNPSTPAGTSTRITIKYSYSLTGPIRQSGGNNQVTYYYKEGAEVANLNATFIFDNSIDLNGNLNPSSGGVVVGKTVNFQKTGMVSNSVFQPYVAFNTVSGQFNKCSGPSGIDIGTIIVIVVIVFVCIVLSIICSIIGFFRRAVSNVFGFRRWGGGPSYGYVSNDYGYNHTHHYHSGGHHHHSHSSGGGGGSRGGITGTSGFAN